MVVGCCPSVAFRMKVAKVEMKPYTTVLTLKSFKNPSFRRSMASSGYEKNIPRKVYIQM